MAKVAKEKTQAAKQLEAAKAALKSAKEKLAKADNASNKANVEAHMKSVKTLTETVNRERFVTIGAARMGKAIEALRNLSKVANARSYAFTEADVKKIEKDLQNEITAVSAAFDIALSPASKKTGEKPSYSFE